MAGRGLVRTGNERCRMAAAAGKRGVVHVHQVRPSVDAHVAPMEAMLAAAAANK